MPKRPQIDLTCPYCKERYRFGYACDKQPCRDTHAARFKREDVEVFVGHTVPERFYESIPGDKTRR